MTSESKQQPTHISFLLTQSSVSCSCCLSIPLNIWWLMNLCLFGDLKALMTGRLEITVILHFSYSFHNLLKITQNIRREKWAKFWGEEVGGLGYKGLFLSILNVIQQDR